ncbi:MAG: ribonuclease H-like domain-containing protein [Patescibacteria group bacterium]
MATLVFDIATAGKRWSQLDVLSRLALTKRTDVKTAEDQLGLSPLTGEVISLGIYDVDRHQGMVYVTGGENGVAAYKVRKEKELLEDFWDGVRSYDVFVTFGGRRFDIPFVLHRSAVHRVAPSKEFRFGRSVEKQQMPYHVDLYDEFSRVGDFRMPLTLHLLAKAYGLESPDTEELRGETVGEFFRQKKFADLAHYTEQNVRVTRELYGLWLEYFAPASFKNILV